MENQTNNQAISDNKIVKVDRQKLEFQNKGVNLLSERKKSIPTIRLYKKVSGNLLEMKSKIIVSHTNLPIHTYYRDETSIEDFFKELEKVVKLPKYDDFIVGNRRQANKGNRWGLTSFDNHIIDYDSIKFSWGDELLKETTLEYREEFMINVGRILDKQRFATDEESKDFARYFVLSYKVEDLGRQSKRKNYSYYSGDRKEDKSLTMLMTDENYNNQLKAIETELSDLNQKYEFLLLPRFDYKEKEDTDDYDEDYDASEDTDEEEYY
jgi:hypothetical protein